MQIDSGVCPGVARTSSVTSPSDKPCPSPRSSIGNSTSAPSPYEIAAPVWAASSRWPLSEVGVDVGLDDSLDRQPLRRRLLEIDADVAPGVDDNGATGCLVTDQVRRMRQTAR